MLISLPCELVLLIAAKLELRDLSSLRASCRALCDFLDDESLYKDLASHYRRVGLESLFRLKERPRAASLCFSAPHSRLHLIDQLRIVRLRDFPVFAFFFSGTDLHFANILSGECVTANNSFQNKISLADVRDGRKLVKDNQLWCQRMNLLFSMAKVRKEFCFLIVVLKESPTGIEETRCLRSGGAQGRSRVAARTR